MSSQNFQKIRTTTRNRHVNNQTNTIITNGVLQCPKCFIFYYAVTESRCLQASKSRGLPKIRSVPVCLDRICIWSGTWIIVKNVYSSYREEIFISCKSDYG